MLDVFIKSRKKKYTNIKAEFFEEAERKIFALRLGGKINYHDIENWDQEFYQFIKLNQLDLKMFALGIQLQPTLEIPFEIQANVYEEVIWQNLERIKLSDASGRYYGYRFFYKGYLVMETNLDFIMVEEFSLLYPGITFYHPKNSLHIAPLDRREESEKNYLEIITKCGKTSPFLLLHKKNGNVYCIGIENGRIAAPSSDYYRAYKCRYKMEISNNEFVEIFDVFEKEKFYKRAVTEKKILEVIQDKLNLQDLPEKKLVGKGKITAYMMLPYAVVKFFCYRSKYPAYTWKDVFKRPHEVSTFNKKMIKKWLEESLLARGGEEKCFD